MGVLFTPGARAMAIQFDTQDPAAQRACLDQAQKSGYLIAGDHESSKPGARLWDLDKLARASKDDNCTANLFKQGLGDQTEYWKYIGAKYGCSKETAKTESKPCALYAENAKYLDSAFHVVMGAQLESNGCEPSSSLPESEQLHRLSVQAESAAYVAAHGNTNFKPLPGYCKGNVPPDELRSPKDPNLSIWELNVVNAKDCGIGVWDFIRSTGMQIAGAYEAIKRIGFFHGLALLSQDIVRHPGDVQTFILNYLEGTFRYFTGDVTQMVKYWSCYKNGIRTQLACSQLAKWAVAYLTGRLVVKPVEGVVGKGLGVAKGWVGKQLYRVPGVSRAAEATGRALGAVTGPASAIRAAATASVKRVFSGKAPDVEAPETAGGAESTGAPEATSPPGKLARLKSVGKKLKTIYHGTVRTVWGAATVSGAVEKQKADEKKSLEKAAEPSILEKLKRLKEEALKQAQHNQVQSPITQPAESAP